VGKLILMTLNVYENLERELEQLRTGKYAEGTHLLRDSPVDDEGTTAFTSKDHHSSVEIQIQEIECLLACAVVVSSE